MSLIVALVSGILLIFGIIVGTQNGNTMVTFYLLKWKFENISLTLLLLESILIGIVISVIISGINIIKMKLEMRDVVRENKNLQEEIKALKNLPFEEEEETEEVEIGEEEKKEGTEA